MPDELHDKITYLPGYVGCLKPFEGWNIKSITTLGDLTIPSCTKKCEEKGYTYAALQHGNECLCSDDAFMKHIDDDAVKSTECNKICFGNNHTVCGGHIDRSIYKVIGFVGCYVNENNATLPVYIQESDSMTVALCRTECRKKGYKYAGLQSGSKCFCGDEILDESSQSSECVKPCNGDEKTICGGTNGTSVYTVGSHLGCFEMAKNESIVKQFKNENMTIPFCKSECQKYGTEFAALTDSNICICMNELDDENNTISGCDKECAGESLTRCGGVDVISVYHIGGYIGCFADNKNRALQFQESNKNMTIKMCRELCFQHNFKYAGLQFAVECYCGNDGYDEHGASNKCTLKCPGKEDTICGGDWATSVYVAKDYSM